MKTLKTLPLAAAIAAGSMMAANAQAEMFWSDNSITLLYGENYENPFGDDRDLTTMTLEHVSGHNWGDVFMFVDRHDGGDDNLTEIYGELSPRFSLSALSGSKLEFGPIKDVLIATTYEFNNWDNDFASGNQDNYLYGVGLDWNIPGLAFFQTNFYQVSNDNIEDDQQLTVVYGAPFSVGSVDVMVDGYIDWSTGENENQKSDFHFNPQVRADVGKFMGITKSKLEVGFEYSYWHNKFGSATDESVFSALAKFHL